jgi:hypothetical protein
MDNAAAPELVFELDGRLPLLNSCQSCDCECDNDIYLMSAYLRGPLTAGCLQRPHFRSIQNLVGSQAKAQNSVPNHTNPFHPRIKCANAG